MYQFIWSCFLSKKILVVVFDTPCANCPNSNGCAARLVRSQENWRKLEIRNPMLLHDRNWGSSKSHSREVFEKLMRAVSMSHQSEFLSFSWYSFCKVTSGGRKDGGAENVEEGTAPLSFWEVLEEKNFCLWKMWHNASLLVLLATIVVVTKICNNKSQQKFLSKRALMKEIHVIYDMLKYIYATYKIRNQNW
jgi:hypothetical protein